MRRQRTHVQMLFSHSMLLRARSRRKTTPPQASFDFAAPFPGSGGATPLSSVSSEHLAVLEAKEEAPPRNPGGAGNRTPVAIILEPARELAEQVSDCLTTFKVRAVLLFVVFCVWFLIRARWRAFRFSKDLDLPLFAVVAVMVR